VTNVGCEHPRVVGNRIRGQACRAMEQKDPDALPEQ
jgi:hypothetical protein